MKNIAVWAVKGGVGKTTVTISLARALKRIGHKVGLADIDITGPKLPVALGIPKIDDPPPPHFPLPEVDTQKGEMYPLCFEGIQVFSEAFLTGNYAVTWHGGDQTKEVYGKTFVLKGTGLYQRVEQHIKSLKYDSDTEYLLLDMPPGTSDVTLSLFEQLPEIYACIIVCQPTSQSADDMSRTIDMLKKKRVPVLGMVGNMTSVLCPDCGSLFYPYADKNVDLKEFCGVQKIPYLLSIPLTNNAGILNDLYDILAGMVVERKPVEPWKQSLTESIQDIATKKITIVMLENIANGN